MLSAAGLAKRGWLGMFATAAGATVLLNAALGDKSPRRRCGLSTSSTRHHSNPSPPATRRRPPESPEPLPGGARENEGPELELRAFPLFCLTRVPLELGRRLETVAAAQARRFELQVEAQRGPFLRLLRD